MRIRSLVLILSVIAFSLSLQTPSHARIDQEKKEGATVKTKSEAKDPSHQHELLLKLKATLDRLLLEANALADDPSKSYAIAQIADAYWLIDQEASWKFFLDALEAARSSGAAPLEKQKQIRFILFTADKRDRGFSKRFTEKLLTESDSPTKPGRNDHARRLLNSQPTPMTGRNEDSAHYKIFDLAGRDKLAADMLFLTYLGKFAANPTLPLNQLLLLAGYAAGRSESVCFLTVDFDEVGIHPAPALTSEPDPQLARIFLDLSYKKLDLWLNQGGRPPSTDQGEINRFLLFSICYLIPDVMKFSPESSPAWRALYRTALTTVPKEGLVIVQRYLRFVNRTRALHKIEPLPTSPLHYSRSAEQIAVELDQKPEGCERDLAILKLLASPEFMENEAVAYETAKKIRDEKAIAGLKEARLFRDAIRSNELGDPDYVTSVSVNLTSPELNALLYAYSAVALARKNDKQFSEASDSARASIVLIEDRAARTVAFLNLLKAYGESSPGKEDVIEGLLHELILQINDISQSNIDRLTLSYKVKTNCRSGEKGSFSDKLGYHEEQSLLAVLPSFKMIAADQLIQFSESILDPTTRIRLTARIAARELEKRPPPTTPASKK